VIPIVETTQDMTETIDSKIDDLFVSLSDHHESIESKLDKVIPITETIESKVDKLIEIELEIQTAVEGLGSRDCVKSPYEITAEGSYLLCDNVSSVSIVANNVSLDLNGFTVSPSGSDNGINIEDNHENIRVHNGIIQGPGSGSGDGILIAGTASNIKIENMQISNFTGTDQAGITFAAGSPQTDCTVQNCIISNCNRGLNLSETSECTFQYIDIKSCQDTGIYEESNSDSNVFYQCKILGVTSSIGIYVDSSNYNAFQECVVSDVSSTSTHSCGIQLNSAANNTIDSCTIGNIDGDLNSYGIYISGTNPLNNTIKNNIINNIGDNNENAFGIYCEPEDEGKHIIDGNIIQELNAGGSYSALGIYNKSNNVLIQNNIISNLTGAGVNYGLYNIGDNTTINENKIQDCTSTGNEAKGIFTNGDNTIITQNIVQHIDGSTEGRGIDTNGNDTQIIGNTIQNINNAGIGINSSGSNAAIISNRLQHCGTNGIAHTTIANGGTLANNIAVNCGATPINPTFTETSLANNGADANNKNYYWNGSV